MVQTPTKSDTISIQLPKAIALQVSLEQFELLAVANRDCCFLAEGNLPESILNNAIASLLNYDTWIISIIVLNFGDRRCRCDHVISGLLRTLCKNSG